MTVELSPKRRAFAREYIIDSNGTQAAIRSGYSERSATSQAAQLLAMPCVQAEIELLRKDAAEAQNVTLSRMYLLLNEACQIARRKESASGMVAAVTAIAKLAGLWVEKHEDLAARDKLTADAQKTELKTAAKLLGEAAESVGLPRSATPAQIVGALAERPVATPEAYRLLRACVTEESADVS
ncbi:terminase small subunit [Bradyrhizobium sp. 4]|uniref:terminase small subunit n=1 Tax=unclassified Bradyrhizobium TaxID=2631580 RepID=UPI001FFBE03C|nr:terminase small subunit [Bradyrhizobium sp. 4]MCK1400127.1 terminase small subunit [Bradyrhizobium sp. 39]MCK1750417.1 terminase small subunit [Bradyrhizobium sp. 135]UPJ32026.1 terminase small subunit [Bradyrhizobium sp. 4]